MKLYALMKLPPLTHKIKKTRGRYITQITRDYKILIKELMVM